MPKKTTKKVTIIQPKRRARPFDLVTGKDSNRIMNAFLSLQATDGWALYVQMYEANIKVLDTQIIEKVDTAGRKLSEEDVDKLRTTRGIYKEMLELPNKTVQETMKLEGIERNPDDPYN